MKKFILNSITCLLILTSANGQPSLTSGFEESFTFIKQHGFKALPVPNGVAFIFNAKDYNSYPSLVLVTNSGELETVSDIKYNKGTLNNMNDFNSAVSFGDKMLVFMENRDKGSGLNKLSIRTLYNSGNLETTETVVGSIEYEKMLKPGEWYTAVTPGGKNIAIIAQYPSEKETDVQFKYYLLDENLKTIKSGNFSFPETKKKVHFNSFHASDKGDFYLVKDESEKTYHYPIVYKISAGEKTGTVISVMQEDPKQKIANYITTMHPNGDLIIGGYIKNKATLTVGEEQVTGNWMYNSATGKINNNLFDKPVSNAVVEGILFNGNTTFLIGEQIKTTRETGTYRQGVMPEENYTYRHSNILVTAFDNEAVKKFELTLSKDFTARNFDQDLYPGFGIVDNKLALVYNDEYGKYFPNTSYTNYKLPVIVYITNDGLMEAPVHFAKEFKTTQTSFTLYPRFSAASTAGMILLAGDGRNIKGVVIK